MGLLAEKFGLIRPLRNYIRSGKPIFGTCAGLILLSDNFVDETLMVFEKYFFIKTWKIIEMIVFFMFY